MFRLRVLGGFAVEGPGGAASSALAQRRAMAILAVLAVADELGCTRERLLALLWPESDEAHARHGLRDALHTIRHALAPEAVRSVGGHLRLDAALVEWDVRAFRRAVVSGRLSDAVEAYGGPLLDGFHLDGTVEFEHWLSAERTRLAREYAQALEELATSMERMGAWVAAERWWARAVEHDPINSHFALRHLQAMAAIGDRANAIQAGELHVRRLREEFGMEPGASVLARIEGIRAGESSLPAAEQPRVPSTVPGPPAPADGTRSDRTPHGPAGEDHGRMAEPPRRARGPHWPAWAAGLAAVLALGAVIQTAGWPKARGAEVRHPRTAIAILPFRDLSPEPSRAYLAVALQDELLAQLAKVAALRIIAPTSVEGYREAAKPPAQIGAELAVGSIVQGSVQVEGDRLRVIVRLADAQTGAALWAETYDRPVGDAFAVQSDIAQRIVTAVGATLSRAQAGDLAAAPTASSEAYLLYLQGLEYAGRAGDQRDNLAIAQRLYEQALHLDPDFALAHAALSMVHARTFSRRLDVSPARADAQLREARAALRLDPELPEGHVAMALTTCCGRSDDRHQLEALTAASHYAPNDAGLWATIAVIQARLGNWDGADRAFERARVLDPRNADLFQAQGNRLHCRRRYLDAIETYRRAMLLAPDYAQPHVALAWSYILWRGQVDTLRAVLASLPDIEPGGGAPRTGMGQVDLQLFDRRPDSVLALLRALRDGAHSSAELFQSVSMTAAAAHFQRGDTAAAYAALDTAVSALDSALRTHPGDARLHMARGMALAQLGRRVDALREVRWLEQSDGYRNNHSCPNEPEARALILAHIGDTDSAVAAVERLLAGTSRISVHTLRLDPLWDPLRGDARFQSLLVAYADPARAAQP